jgi:spore germination cell wall hydrolase CwlJ-like protein
LFFLSQTRAKARALVSVVLTGTVLGAGLGGILGGAYLAGGYAQAASTHARVSELADVASGGYAEQDLQRVVSRMDDSALAIARRHDPFTSAGGAQRDRQAALFAARLERRDDGRTNPGQTQGLMLRASFITGSGSPAARPFRLDGALDASRDLECLTEAVYYEARGETPAGQAAVAQVVLNRVRHPAFPKSICGVVYQRAYGGGTCQFSFACDGSMRKRRDAGAWARAERVATRALSGEVMAQVGNATHFHTIYVSPSWGPRLIKVGQVGLHLFYRFGGRSGAPGAFDVVPERSGPQIGDQPLFAGKVPGEPIPYASLKQPEEVVFIAAAATTAPSIVLVDGAGMGGPGPAHKPVEPASAPKPVAKPAAAKPAAKAPKVETEASIKPEQTSAAAS